MTHTLFQLREMFGNPLLAPPGREIVLTPKARAMTPRVRRIVASIEQLARPHCGPGSAYAPGC